MFIYLLIADQIKKAIGSNAAMATLPPYAAILALPLLFFPPSIDLGSTFKLSAVEEEVSVADGRSNEGTEFVVLLLVVTEFDWVVNAEAELTAIAATMKRVAMNLFMVVVGNRCVIE